MGQRQVFCRTAGCTLGCVWCDTQYSHSPSSEYVVCGLEETVRTGPVDAVTASGEILRVTGEMGSVDTVSITGGEPLEQPEFVTAIARLLTTAGKKVYLETNGVHAGALEVILPYIDILAMDMKLPSAIGSDLWPQHEAFISRIKGTPFVPGNSGSEATFEKKDVFVKVVIDGRSRLEEIETAAGIVARISAGIPLILQPESGTLMSPEASGLDRREFRKLIEDCVRMAGDVLEEVRVIPQCHKILGIR